MPYRAGDGVSAKLVAWRVMLPDNSWLVQTLLGALNELLYSSNWEASEEVSADLAANTFQDASDSLMPYPDLIGMIMLWGHTSTSYPDGVLPCDGAIYQEAEYPELFAVLGHVFSNIGDPSGTFRVPDMRGRVAIGEGQGAGLSNREFADMAGAEDVTLGTAQLPTHSHSDAGHIHSIHSHITGLAVAPGELPVSCPNPLPESTSSGNAANQNAGSGQPFDIMPPFTVLSYVIVCGVKIA